MSDTQRPEQSNQSIGDVINNVLRPLFQKVDRQMTNDARLFRSGRITQQEYERRCQWRGCAPPNIEGFYKWDGGGTSGLPDWNAGKTRL